MSQILQFAASLIAILALAWLARRLALGGDTRIHDEAHARELAQEVVCDFDAEDVAVDRAGNAALLRDRTGRLMILRKHGAHFAGRLLEGEIGAQRDDTRLTLPTHDRRFGAVTLDLGQDAPHWATMLRRVEG